MNSSAVIMPKLSLFVGAKFVCVLLSGFAQGAQLKHILRIVYGWTCSYPRHTRLLCMRACCYLRKLDLNKLSSTIPASFGSLVSLKYFVLHQNQVSLHPFATRQFGAIVWCNTRVAQYFPWPLFYTTTLHSEPKSETPPENSRTMNYLIVVWNTSEFDWLFDKTGTIVYRLQFQDARASTRQHAGDSHNCRFIYPCNYPCNYSPSLYARMLWWPIKRSNLLSFRSICRD